KQFLTSRVLSRRRLLNSSACSDRHHPAIKGLRLPSGQLLIEFVPLASVLPETLAVYLGDPLIHLKNIFFDDLVGCALLHVQGAKNLASPSPQG
ncbi:hypothetical protein Ahia01_000700700, partial [Argonauta hians]